MKKLALTTLVTAALALSGAQALAQTRTLVLSTFGFNGALLKKHVFEPFEAQCGCKIVLETGNASERIAKLDARRNNPNVDVIQVGDFLAQEASFKGLLQPIDHSKLKNLAEVHDFGRDPLGNREAIAYTVYSIGLVVRTDKPSAQVESWKDLWRPDLKGHLMLANITGQQGMAQLFMADRAWGGSGSADMATGMKKIGELKDNVVTYYAQSAQMTAMFAQDEAWVAPVGRFGWSNLVKTGKPLKWVVPREGQVGVLNTMSIVKGAKNADLAHQLIDFWLSKDVQTALANDLVDSPINRNAQPRAEVQDALTYGKAQIESLVVMKPEMVARERANWVNAWNRVIAK